MEGSKFDMAILQRRLPCAQSIVPPNGAARNGLREQRAAALKRHTARRDKETAVSPA